MNPLVLLAVLAAAALAMAKKQTARLQKAISRAPRFALLPRAVTALVLAAQLSELVKAMEHADIVRITAALMLLGVMAAAKNGTEEGTH